MPAAIGCCHGASCHPLGLGLAPHALAPHPPTPLTHPTPLPLPACPQVFERTVYDRINRWLTSALRFLPGGDGSSCASASYDGTVKVHMPSGGGGLGLESRV